MNRQQQSGCGVSWCMKTELRQAACWIRELVWLLASGPGQTLLDFDDEDSSVTIVPAEANPGFGGRELVAAEDPK